jgi:hypothetical protein
MPSGQSPARGRLPFQHRQRVLGRVRLDHPAQQRQRLGQRLVRLRRRALARRRRRAQQHRAGRRVAARRRQLLQRLRAIAIAPSFVASVTAASSTAPSPGADVQRRAHRPPRALRIAQPPGEIQRSPDVGRALALDRRASSAAACSAPRPTS